MELQPMDQRFLTRIASYLPAWQISQEETEPEAAILYAAWRLLEDTRQRLDRLPAKHEVEFLRAWGLEPADAAPRSVYASLSAPEGAAVPAGSALYLSGSGTRIWKTTCAAHAESLALVGQVLESGRLGTLLALPPPSPEQPTRLFDFRAPGHQRQAVRFAHRDAFCSQGGCTAYLHFPDSAEVLLSFLSNPSRVRWTLETTTGPGQTLPTPQQDGSALRFSLPPAPTATALTVDVLPGAPAPSEGCGLVYGATVRENLPYQAAICDDGTVTEGSFHPFGLRPELWRTCYLSCPDALTLRGAQVTLSYTLTFTTWEEPLPGAQQPPEYRPVMRRLPVPPPVPRDVSVQSVAWEYWNGSAWLPIPGARDWSSSFAWESPERVIQVHFSWPSDARPCLVKGLEGNWLRWRIVRADGAATLPRRLHAPEVQNLHFCARLQGSAVERFLCSGLTSQFQRCDSSNPPLFPPLGPQEDGWWLMWNHAPHSDILSLFAALTGRVMGTTLTAWESTPDGLRPLTLEDETGGLCHSGLLILSGIRGQMTTRFGRHGWWLCLRDQSGCLSQGRRYPRLTALFPGAVCLQAQSGDLCQAGEPALPLRGGAVCGITLTDSFGGAPPEQRPDVLSRARQYRHHLGRGVSPLDVEELVRARFHDVVRTRSRREGSRVVVAVLMRDVHAHSAAFAQWRDSIVRLLAEKTAVPTLGLSIEVREPNFYPISGMIWLRSSPDSDPQADQEAVRQALAQFLHPVTGKFRANGWRMGDLPQEQEVRNYLQDRLPHVKLVKLVLTAVTPQGLEVDCAGVQDPFALPVSGNHTIFAVQGGRLG